jgi:hypothetical protein
MSDDFETPDVPADNAPVSGRRQLSGRVVPWLSLPEQLVLWALRQRLSSGRPAPADPVLARGFLLAFGLAACEAALREFEACFTLLATRSRRDILLCPLACGCISVDEELILLLLAPQPADGRTAAAQRNAAASLVAEDILPSLLEACADFRLRLATAGIAQPQGCAPFPRGPKRVLH